MKLETSNPQSAIRNPQSIVLESPIFLIGFMASGKSTVGPVLAAKLNCLFIDLDPLIESKAGCTIAELIAREGEAPFRQLETETLREVSRREPAIIAPGGGAITRVENRNLMSQYGLTIWLDTPFDLCWQRIQKDKIIRPLAPNEEIALEHYKQRLPFYREAALTISISRSQFPDEIAEAIIKRLER